MDSSGSFSFESPCWPTSTLQSCCFDLRRRQGFRRRGEEGGRGQVGDCWFSTAPACFAAEDARLRLPISLMFGPTLAWFGRMFLVLVLEVLVLMRTSLGLPSFVVVGVIWIYFRMIKELGLNAADYIARGLVLCSPFSVLRFGV